MAVQREKWACSSSVHAENDDTRPPDIHGVSVTHVFNDFGGDVAERASERGELLVGKAEEFSLWKDEQENQGWGNGLAYISNLRGQMAVWILL